jgi:GNAT superfamily N-acetyltransferase
VIDRKFLSGLRIEPLDRNRHDRAAFESGVDRVDNFLANTAFRHHAEDHSKTYVAVEPPSNRIVGFYTLSPHAIDISTLPLETLKKLPRFSTISAIYLATLGVHLTRQGHGLGTYLMADFLKTCVRIANIGGGHFVVLDAINDDAARMYRRIGFTDLPDQEPRMLMSMARVRKAVQGARGG